MVITILIITIIACIVVWAFRRDTAKETEVDDEIRKIEQEEININAALDKLYEDDKFWLGIND